MLRPDERPDAFVGVVFSSLVGLFARERRPSAGDSSGSSFFASSSGSSSSSSSLPPLLPPPSRLRLPCMISQCCCTPAALRPVSSRSATAAQFFWPSSATISRSSFSSLSVHRPALEVRLRDRFPAGASSSSSSGASRFDALDDSPLAALEAFGFSSASSAGAAPTTIGPPLVAHDADTYGAAEPGGGGGGGASSCSASRSGAGNLSCASLWMVAQSPSPWRCTPRSSARSHSTPQPPYVGAGVTDGTSLSAASLFTASSRARSPSTRRTKAVACRAPRSTSQFDTDASVSTLPASLVCSVASAFSSARSRAASASAASAAVVPAGKTYGTGGLAVAADDDAAAAAGGGGSAASAAASPSSPSPSSSSSSSPGSTSSLASAAIFFSTSSFSLVTSATSFWSAERPLMSPPEQSTHLSRR